MPCGRVAEPIGALGIPVRVAAASKMLGPCVRTSSCVFVCACANTVCVINR